MKKVNNVQLYIFIFIISIIETKAQNTEYSNDTILILGHGKTTSYLVTGTPIKTLDIGGFGVPVITSKILDAGSRGFTPGDLNIGSAITSLTGIGTGSTSEVYYKYPGWIGTNTTSNNWNTNIYWEGSYSKDRERVTNYDGSHSVNTTEERHIYWYKGAKSVIIEMKDTIGKYEVTAYPNSESKVIEYTGIIATMESSKRDSVFSPKWKYASYGEFRGKESALLYNAAENKIYILEGKEIIGIFLSVDYSRQLRKKDRIEFKLFVPENLDESTKNDMVRLAMYGQILKFISYDFR